MTTTHDNNLPALGTIYIDNYDELLNSQDAQTLPAVVSCVRQFIVSEGGLVRHYEAGRFMILMEQMDLDRVLSHRFALLDRVREIPTPSALPITLSIAIGIGATLQEASESSRQALELALGRGGDQAVIKRERTYRFYGGKQQPGERYSRVKSRVFARTLGQLMRQYDNIMLMGHKMADFDSLGASVGLFACAKALQKPAHIVLDQSNDMIGGVMNTLRASEELRAAFHSPEETENLCGDNTLLIVLDTQRAAGTALPALLESAGATAVIDHHRRGIDAIEGATLQYIQVHASSTCEIICEIIQYFHPDVKLTPMISSALLSGLTIDTKQFAVNTSARTFEAAAYLRKHGADANFIRELFMDDREAFLARAEVVRQAQPIRPQILLSYCNGKIGNAVRIAAQAADTLSQMRDVQAAFVMAQTERGISVSGRSSGKINVQLILETLGGGGHLNVAGAQFPAQSMDEVADLLKNAVANYLSDDKPVPEYS